MNEKVKIMLGPLYFGIFGIVVVGIGLAEILLGVTGRSFEYGIMEMAGEFILWRGLILFFAGIFYLSSIKNFVNIHQFAKTVMASVMIWIVGGMQIFSMILESIPGGEEGWFNTWQGFIETYAPPYPPAILLLPFSLVVLYYIRLREELANK